MRIPARTAALLLPVLLLLTLGAVPSTTPVPSVTPLASATTANRVSAPTPILFDPGPTARCYGTIREFYAVPRPPAQTGGYDVGDCARVDTPDRVDANCASWFPYTGRYGQVCPVWSFVTVDWRTDDFADYPGFETKVWGRSGSPLTLVTNNNTRQLTDCVLRETAVSFQYPSSSLRHRRPGAPFTLADGRLKVSYTAWAEAPAGFGCREQRALLTTDLVWTAGGKKHVVSVVHFDPGHFAGTPRADGVLWDNDCAGGGCRVTVLGQQIRPATSTPLTVDFQDLTTRLAPYLTPGAVGSDATILAVQFVNSTRGSDLQTRVSDVNVVLHP